MWMLKRISNIQSTFLLKYKFRITMYCSSLFGLVCTSVELWWLTDDASKKFQKISTQLKIINVMKFSPGNTCFHPSLRRLKGRLRKMWHSYKVYKLRKRLSKYFPNLIWLFMMNAEVEEFPCCSPKSLSIPLRSKG